MYIRKGRSRIVFIFPALEIVVKLPIIHLLEVLRYGIKHRQFKRLAQEYHYEFYTVKELLFDGIYSNWMEFYFYWKTRHPFLQPTYFSLFGFLNIQRLSGPCKMDYRDMFHQFYELTQSTVTQDSHHFQKQENFCVHRGKLRILDYGSKSTRKVIAEYGDEILVGFDVKFRREEHQTYI